MQHESSAEKQKQLILSPQENRQDGQLQPKMEPHSLQIADKSEAQISEQSHEHFSEDRIRHPDNKHQYPKLPSVSNQQTLAVNPTNNPVVITPHLDKGRAMQLNTIYNRLRKNEIGKDEFLRHMKNIVGDEMLRQAKGQSVRMDPSQVSTSTVQVQTDSSQKPDNRFRITGDARKPKAFFNHGLGQSRKRGPVKQVPLHQAMASTQPGSAAQPMIMSASMKYEMHNSTNDPRRLQGGSHPHITSHPTLQHNQVPWQSSMSKEQKSNGVSLMANVDQGYTASSRTLNSETMDTQSTRIAMSACTAVTDTIPALNPSTPVRTQVTSSSTLGAGININGVDLREEEEQLLSGPKVESQASEATRRAVQEEEENLILQKIPLQKKLVNILFSCGVKNISSDVERCLSLCVEERMRRILINLVQLSKQRIDIERPRHRTPITSDVGRQIFSMNQKVKEEWDKKQAEEAEKLRKINEVEGNRGADGDKEKDDGRLKSLKGPKINYERILLCFNPRLCAQYWLRM
ncbi:hypothetical protein GIB67_035785 [Kingdonia uniflora]|uniref:RST domain-containing protein n=1 Tax=Kingdonia uniflora TaxID=39325 RepID=A0A7J7MJX4_9MAGN|nr:hypothetical protein GIB67_035785 [Kingdonia uniflora]